MAAKKEVKIRVVCDMTCPYCWIGKRRLLKCMDHLKRTHGIEFDLKWTPYQLRFESPPEGMPVPPEYKEPEKLNKLREAGKGVDIPFTFSYTRWPNTALAHALLDFVASKCDDCGDKQTCVAEMLFKTHFTDGTMLSEETVINIGREAGYDAEEVKAYINNPDEQKMILEESKKNVDKVKEDGEMIPIYYFNGKKMVVGAQSEEFFLEQLMTAAGIPCDQQQQTVKG